ncbi:MAG: hypothetical protein M9904_02335 [Chitinophagaceae bacterium]|nr:hypothetical protein [Chitinophagaceae bacterium]
MLDNILQLLIIAVFLQFIVLAVIFSINKKNSLIMSTQEQFAEVLEQIKTNTENIAGDIVVLTDRLAAGGLTAEEEANVLTELRAVAGRLKEIADITPDAEQPAPEAPTDPVEPEAPEEPEEPMQPE